jgi:CDP-paratose 2-epimerase
MNVLVTGGCGFLGSHICEFYAKSGHRVIAFDNLTKHELNRTNYDVQAARTYVLNYLKKMGIETVIGDIRNKDALSQVSKDCDYIINAAAQPAMTISIEDPELDISSNVMGTFNVLETARKKDIPIVTCSSIHVYGNKINETLKEDKTRFIRDPPTINEEHPTLEGTVTPLHASKRTTEIYVQSYIDTYGVVAGAFRCTGMYGPRQFGAEDHGWVANFAIKMLLKKPITIFGTGKQVRDILYATDAVSAFDAFYKSKVPGIYNIGGGVDRLISLDESIELMEEITGNKVEVKYAPMRTGDLWYFASDITRAKKNLGWSPKVSNRVGITQLISWIADNASIFKGAAL